MIDPAAPEWPGGRRRPSRWGECCGCSGGRCPPPPPPPPMLPLPMDCSEALPYPPPSWLLLPAIGDKLCSVIADQTQTVCTAANSSKVSKHCPRGYVDTRLLPMKIARSLETMSAPETERWWLGRGGMPLAAGRPGGVPCCCEFGAAPWLLAADDGRRLPLPADARPPPPTVPPRGLLLTLGRPGVLSGLLASVSPATHRVVTILASRSAPQVHVMHSALQAGCHTTTRESSSPWLEQAPIRCSMWLMWHSET